MKKMNKIKKILISGAVAGTIIGVGLLASSADKVYALENNVVTVSIENSKVAGDLLNSIMDVDATSGNYNNDSNFLGQYIDENSNYAFNIQQYSLSSDVSSNIAGYGGYKTDGVFNQRVWIKDMASYSLDTEATSYSFKGEGYFKNIDSVQRKNGLVDDIEKCLAGAVEGETVLDSSINMTATYSVSSQDWFTRNLNNYHDGYEYSRLSNIKKISDSYVWNSDNQSIKRVTFDGDAIYIESIPKFSLTIYDQYYLTKLTMPGFKFITEETSPKILGMDAYDRDELILKFNNSNLTNVKADLNGETFNFTYAGESENGSMYISDGVDFDINGTKTYQISNYSVNMDGYLYTFPEYTQDFTYYKDTAWVEVKFDSYSYSGDGYFGSKYTYGYFGVQNAITGEKINTIKNISFYYNPKKRSTDGQGLSYNTVTVKDKEIKGVYNESFWSEIGKKWSAFASLGTNCEIYLANEAQIDEQKVDGHNIDYYFLFNREIEGNSLRWCYITYEVTGGHIGYGSAYERGAHVEIGEDGVSRVYTADGELIDNITADEDGFLKNEDGSYVSPINGVNIDRGHKNESSPIANLFATILNILKFVGIGLIIVLLSKLGVFKFIKNIFKGIFRTVKRFFQKLTK